MTGIKLNMQLDKFLVEISTRPIEGYACGIVCNLAGLQFSIGSDSAELIDNAMHYLFPHASAPVGRWDLSVEAVGAEIYAHIVSGLKTSSVVTVKAGFAYLRGTAGDYAFFVSATGFSEDPHVILVCGSRVSVVAPFITEVVSRLPIRIIREIALRLRQNSGGCFVHCAAVQVANLGIMIVGASGAGKTTTLLNILRDTDARFIANDRGIVSANENDLTFDAWPLAVRVGLGTTRSFYELTNEAERLKRSENKLTHERIALDAAMAWGSKVKLEYTPLELCYRFNRHAAMQCGVGAIVLPHLNLSGEPCVLRSIEPTSSVVDVLDEEITEPVDPEYGTGWLGLRSISVHQGQANKQLVIERLQRIPLFELVGDPRFASLETFSVLKTL